MQHLKWLEATDLCLKTNDGYDVPVWVLNHDISDSETLSAWARHFRNQYCLDSDIDILKSNIQTRREYLINIKFPDETQTPGPSIRSGDFGEILIADYLEFCMQMWVPRFRWSSKYVKNESAKGSDVIGFNLDEAKLYVFECKAQLSVTQKTNTESIPKSDSVEQEKKALNCLQKAINDSPKDLNRLAESLNFLKQRFHDKKDFESRERIERFQNPTDVRYSRVYGAAAIIDESNYDSNNFSAVSYKLDFQEERMLILVKGEKMMELVHELYRRAADEAGT